MTAYYL